MIELDARLHDLAKRYTKITVSRHVTAYLQLHNPTHTPSQLTTLAL
jgi:hypothetical protein